MNRFLLTILFLTVLKLNLFSQPVPFNSTLLFNLTEVEYSSTYITIEEVKSGKVKFLSNYPGCELKYDTLHKAFSFTTYGSECKVFAMVYKNDTIFINFPSLEYVKAIYIRMAIPLNGKSYGFYNEYTYDALHSNESALFGKIYNICQGCFISNTYLMNKPDMERIDKKRFGIEVKIKE